MTAANASHTETENELLAMLNELNSISDSIPEPEPAAVVPDEISALEGIKTLALDFDVEKVATELDLSIAKVGTNVKIEEDELAQLVEAEAVEVVETKPAEETEAESVENVLSEVEKTASEKPVKASKNRAERKKTEQQLGAPPTETGAKKTRRGRFSLADLTEAQFEELGIDQAGFQESLQVMPVKAVDKVNNVLAWYFNGNELSVYTQISIKTLIKSGSCATSTIRLAMMSNPSKPYPSSTAGSQSGQMMSLLPLIGVATKPTAGQLQLNNSSAIVKKFNKEF